MSEQTAICFDLDGTLVHYERGFDAIVKDALGATVGTVTDEQIAAFRDGFFAAFDAHEPAPYHAGMAAALAATDGQVGEGSDLDAGGPSDEDLDELVAALRETELAATTVPEATHDCLEALAADDETSLVVLTDGVGEWQREKLAHHDLSSYFDHVVVSYDVGGHKEAGTPYEAVRDRVAATEYVMVGDDPGADVTAARRAGFVPVHYDAETDLFAVLRALL